ncbi:protein PSK SIMULATOR 1 isoform X2 [Cryptomeria japonica]|uniref:protein PSK SIMULATOR 1 isoform X2 n=1 Tax=Cryptomeria japonica TaxID=3369 RepID=UPI0027D9FF93|nr:protein PSK SIMULATOR 1 isoform X2 [Cryptomeria japonica]
MGAICSRRFSFGGHRGGISMNSNQLQSNMTDAIPTPQEEQDREQTSFSTVDNRSEQKRLSRVLSGKATAAKSKTQMVAKRGAAKVSEVGSLLGRAGTLGLGKAVEALDTLGSSMTNLNLSSGFASGGAPKGNKIAILSFEVANTVVKGANLMQSLSEDNIRLLKEEILHSEGVQILVSNDMDELMRIVAADKRDELKVFAGEVVRFGNHCRDPQWHQLDRYFEKLGREIPIQKQSKADAEAVMQELMTLAQNTAELYHELHALDRFDQDYRRKLQEDESSNEPERGEGLGILRSELKSQKKHVKNLKKKSLWSKFLEEVMEKLVDIVYFLHQEIEEAFGDAAIGIEYPVRKTGSIVSQQRLGKAGLSLHYANIINQIDRMVSRPSSVPPNTRDSLYQGLPPNIKSALRSRLHSSTFKEEPTIAEIKAEMEKILAWLVPVATNTTKAHHGFGWVGEWASTGSSFDQKLPGQNELTLIQTLHHASKETTESYILDLIVLLHHLVNHARSTPSKSPIRSPVQTKVTLGLPTIDKRSATSNGHLTAPQLSQEDKNMLKDVNKRKLTPGISKSQEFDTLKPRSFGQSVNRLSKSNSHSPTRNRKSDSNEVRRHQTPAVPAINFDIDRIKALDVIDRVDTLNLL